MITLAAPGRLEAIDIAFAEIDRAAARAKAIVLAAVTSTEPPRQLGRKEAAARLGCHVDTLRSYSRLGLGRKVGGRWVYSEDEIDAFARSGGPAFSHP